MNLAELQKAIDYIRENSDDWATMPIQTEIDLDDGRFLVSEIAGAYVPENEDVLVFVNSTKDQKTSEEEDEEFEEEED